MKKTQKKHEKSSLDNGEDSFNWDYNFMFDSFNYFLGKKCYGIHNC